MSSIVTANALRTGAVVYLAGGGRWVSDITAAAVAEDAAALAPLEAIARDAVQRRDVTAVYAFDVKVVGGRVAPISVREQIRATHAHTIAF